MMSGRMTPVRTWRDLLDTWTLLGERDITLGVGGGPAKSAAAVNGRKKQSEKDLLRRGKLGRSMLRPYKCEVPLLREDRFAGEAGGGAEFFFDAQELIVFCDAVGARGGTGFDLSGGGGD